MNQKRAAFFEQVYEPIQASVADVGQPVIAELVNALAGQHRENPHKRGLRAGERPWPVGQRTQGSLPVPKSSVNGRSYIF